MLSTTYSAQLQDIDNRRFLPWGSNALKHVIETNPIGGVFMAVRFLAGGRELELKPLTLLHGGTSGERRELLLSVHALFTMLTEIKLGGLYGKFHFALLSEARGSNDEICLDIEELARALEVTYKEYVTEFLEEKLGYVPSAVPELSLIADGKCFVKVKKYSWSCELEYVNENDHERSFMCETGAQDTEETLYMFTPNVFAKAFMSDEIGIPVSIPSMFFPVERECFSEITKPVKVDGAVTIGKSLQKIKEQVVSQVSPKCKLTEEFLDRCLIPLMLNRTFLSRKELREEFTDILLEGGRIELAEDLVPVYSKSGKVTHVRELSKELTDLMPLLKAVESLYTNVLIVEDVDRYKSPEYQAMLWLFFEELVDGGKVVVLSTEGRYLVDLAETYTAEEDSFYGIYALS